MPSVEIGVILLFLMWFALLLLPRQRKSLSVLEPAVIVGGVLCAYLMEHTTELGGNLAQLRCYSRSVAATGHLCLIAERFCVVSLQVFLLLRCLPMLCQVLQRY